MEFHKILVPVVGTKADEEAIKVACKLTDKKAKDKISIVHVITVERTLPLDAEMETEIEKAEEILDRMENIAQEHGGEVETELLQARDVGQTIVDEATEREADLILMGSTYKLPFGQFSLGDVVPYILKCAPCHVILYQHQYPTNEV